MFFQCFCDLVECFSYFIATPELNVGTCLPQISLLVMIPNLQVH